MWATAAKGLGIAAGTLGTALLLVLSAPLGAGEGISVEGFTIRAAPFLVPTPPGPGLHIEIYEIDGLERFEEAVSAGLPGDPQGAKVIALERLGEQGVGDRAELERAALGLTRAAAHGLDRYPAIVLDHRAVVYGVTDVDEALRRYRVWRAETDR